MRKRIFAIFAAIFVSAIIGGCGAMFITEIDFSAIPDPLDIPETNKFYTETSIAFSGDPANDFPEQYSFVTNPANTEGGGMRLNNIYLAYSKRYLYIGHKMIKDSTDSPGFLGRGSFYIYIDNNIASGNGSTGMRLISANNNGVSGNFDFLDDSQMTIANGKASVFIKHYRPFQYSAPTGENFKIYQLFNEAVNKEYIVGNASSMSITRYLTNGVTEVAIPWSYIFGAKPDSIPDSINLEFVTDDGADGKYYSEQNFAANDTTTNIISNWVNLRLK